MKSLEFNNLFTQNLPGDSNLENSRRQVFHAIYSWVVPRKCSNPALLIYSEDVAQNLGLSIQDCESDMFLQTFVGNHIPQGTSPYAMCYGGHQFGHWAGQLGDGRAINLGEVTIGDKTLALQLKGAGETPYSRTADGLAVLRSSVREFLCSEAMFYLGVPTTRALSLCSTGDFVWRDMFYNGNAAYEKGAVVCRVSPSFLRFGSFEIFAAREDIITLQQLVNYTIESHFPHLMPENGIITTGVILAWFQEVSDLTQTMIIHWMRVGFVHGVMNTDNMSILGLTIDYGPYGWLEDYDPDWTPNTTDAQYHRYAFANQPKVSHWNLAQLAQALAPLFNDVSPLQEIINNYSSSYLRGWHNMMADKLGLQQFDAETDAHLMATLFDTLQLTETDMTIFFRALSRFDLTKTSGQNFDLITDAFYTPDNITSDIKIAWLNWLRIYAERLTQDGIAGEIRARQMNAVNPKFVLRNYMAQVAIDLAEIGDFSELHRLLKLLRRPYNEQPTLEKYASKRPEWGRQKPGCSTLSCSS